jgi:hypothetical protein
MSEGRKDDTGKLRFDLIAPDCEKALAEILTFGAKKYDDRNWEKGLSFGRVYGAMRRHQNSFWSREDLDDETGLLHLAHAYTCLHFLLHYQLNKEIYGGFDDRP